MDREFWHDRWREGRIGFHEGVANAMLVQHIEQLNLPKGGRVFLPLCGKTRDIAWLLDRGQSVAGAELSTLAVEQLFADLNLTPEITAIGALNCYSAQDIDIFVGDIFELTPADLGPVDAVYDRAALVALPEGMRARYAAHLRDITGRAAQLLVTFEYDQAAMDGPPFSLSPAEVQRLYGADFTITKLDENSLPDGIRGAIPATETAWHLGAK